MKTIFEIFIIGIVAVVMFTGVGLINQYMFDKGNLNEDSVNLYYNYNTELATLVSEYNSSYNIAYVNGTVQGEVETDVNTLDAFIKEYGEAKAKVSILRQTTNMITHIPRMIILAIPFVDQENIDFYEKALFYFIIIIVVVALFNALFRKEVSK